MTPENDRDGEERTYLFTVSYADDAERKRVEYLFNNWEDGDVAKPDGLIRVAADVDHDELYEKIVNKVPADQVDSYELQPVEANVEKHQETVTKTIDAPTDAVESFVEYILSKKKAVLQSATRNEYEVYTKKGRADISYDLTDTDTETTVTITITGYPPSPPFLAEFFDAELTDYAESQH